MAKTRRLPAVAGTFYEADPQALRAQIEWAFTHELGPGSVPSPSAERKKSSIGFVSPHAGYMYSGPIAAHVYYHVALEGPAETYIIIGPNHTGLGTLVSVMIRGVWVTPLGEVEIDEQLAKRIVELSELADPDEKAHVLEHSVEVQIPFIQYFFGSKFKIVPIVMYDQSPRAAEDLAKAIHKAVTETGRDIVLIASSDFTHYEPHEAAVKKDTMAIQAILGMDPERFYNTVTSYNISVCGPGPIMTVMYYARMLGTTRAELLKYATSGDVSGEKSAVVGYAAIRFPAPEGK